MDNANKTRRAAGAMAQDEWAKRCSQLISLTSQMRRHRRSSFERRLFREQIRVLFHAHLALVCADGYRKLVRSPHRRAKAIALRNLNSTVDVLRQLYNI